MRMSVILLTLGIVVAAAGIATVGFGIPINEFTLGTTLIITGTTALTGGLILIGLSAVVTELGRVAEGLKTRAGRGAAATRAAEAQEPILQPPTQPAISPASQPIMPPAAPAAPGIAPPAPAVAAGPRLPSQPSMPPRPAPELPMSQPRQPEYYPQPAPSAVEVSAAAIERLRSSIPRTERPRGEPPEVADIEGVPLSPNGAAHHRAPQSRPPVGEPVPPEPRAGAEDRASGAAEALKASRLDFLFRSKAAAGRPAPQPENFDAFWPADGRGPRGAPAGGEPAPRADYAAPAPAPSQPPSQPQGHAQDHAHDRHEAPPHDEGPAPAILKSGVVDGMAYTLYSDGSIEAKLPHGTVRFGSIAELRAHIESNS
jgi:hypothetical protein